MSKISINEQFIKAVSYLIDNDIVKKKRFLAQELGCSPQIFSEILNGRMNVQLVMLQNLFDHYNISYDFIFKGEGVIINFTENKDNNYVLSKRDNSIKADCPSCKEKDRTIDSQADTIALLKEKVESLKEKISALESRPAPAPDSYRQTA